MKMTLSAHPLFDFLSTITTLQRGKEDILNLIEKGAWQRCFQIKQKLVLISTAFDGQVHIKVQSGEAKKQDVHTLISHCLGLDDPLLQQDISDSRLDLSWGIAVPGYPSIFEALIQTLFGQLVSVPVANQMRRRFILACGIPYEYESKIYYAFPEPKNMILFNEADLKVLLCTSQMKVRSIFAIARAFVEEDLERKLFMISCREEQYRYLKLLYGVGHWTVDWIMLRALRQFDVVPATDLAVRKAVSWWAKKDTLLSEKETLNYTECFKPYAGAMVYRILCAYVKNQIQQKLII